VREREETTHARLLLTGLAYRQKLVGAGSRQILAVHMGGDLVDLQGALLRTSDHNVQALTDVDVAEMPVEAIRQLVSERPAVGLAMWYDTLVDASIHREWTANIGQRTARVRLCHLLCELGVRMYDAGRGTLNRYELPMTQQDFGDALGLTGVHVNRTFKGLSEESLVEKRRSSVYIKDWNRLVQAGDFSPHYLHLQDDLQAGCGSSLEAARSGAILPALGNPMESRPDGQAPRTMALADPARSTIAMTGSSVT